MYKFCLLWLSETGDYGTVWATESRMWAWFIIHHYRAEELASKPALITLLTGCQANKNPEQTCQWKRLKHLESVHSQQSLKTTRQHEEGYLWISQPLHFQRKCHGERGRRLSGSENPSAQTEILPNQPKHKTNQTKQAWTLLCLSLGQQYFFFWCCDILFQQPGGTARRVSAPGGVFIWHFTAVTHNPADNFTQGERRHHPLFVCTVLPLL